MQVTGISSATGLAHPRDRERDGKQADRQRARFSARHVILDLSREAMLQIGHEPLSFARPPRQLLFVYNDSGAFAYDAPDQPRNETRLRSPSDSVEPDPTRIAPEPTEAIEEIGAAEAPSPSFVSFDGMLGARM